MHDNDPPRRSKPTAPKLRSTSNARGVDVRVALGLGPAALLRHRIGAGIRRRRRMLDGPATPAPGVAAHGRGIGLRRHALRIPQEKAAACPAHPAAACRAGARAAWSGARAAAGWSAAAAPSPAHAALAVSVPRSSFLHGKGAAGPRTGKPGGRSCCPAWGPQSAAADGRLVTGSRERGDSASQPRVPSTNRASILRRRCGA
jgi:hypothetical protein